MQSATNGLIEFTVLAKGSSGNYSPIGATAFNVESIDTGLSFGARMDVPLNSVQTSTAQIAMNNAPLRFTATGGEYSIDGGAWSSAPGTIQYGNSVAVRATASSSALTPTSVTLTPSAGAPISFTVVTGLNCSLDLSGDARFSSTDATIIVRWLLGFDASALGSGLFTPALTSSQSAAIAARVQLLVEAGVFDVDGDGATLSTTDGAIISRLAAGIRDGTALTGVSNPLGTRTTYNAIRDHLNTHCSAGLP
jgi:hypothetical protein